MDKWISSRPCVFFLHNKIAVKADEYDERKVDRKIFLPVSLAIDFILYMILDRGFIRKGDVLNKQTKSNVGVDGIQTPLFFFILQTKDGFPCLGHLPQSKDCSAT